MEVIRGIGNLKSRHEGAVVTIGNFDGVHLGHQAILAKVNQKARDLGTHSMLVCFEPQPKEFFDTFNAPARLTRFREKVEKLAEYGLDYVLCLKFDEQTRSMSASEFTGLLTEKIKLRGLFVGDDFKFGFDRSGEFKHLQQAGERLGFDVVDLYTIAHDDIRVSSTRIRECLANGDFELAEELLGYPYSISGKVVYGRQIGRTLGVPTANVQLHRYVAPIAGVFAVEVLIGEKVEHGVANVGVRPTIDDATLQPILEVHLFNFSEDIYGTMVKVIFIHKIRDEKKFDGIESLKQAIHSDVEATKQFFGVS